MFTPIMLMHRPHCGPVSQFDYDVAGERLEVTFASGEVYAYVVSYDSWLTLVDETDAVVENLHRLAGSRHPGVVPAGQRLSDLYPIRMEVDRDTLPVISGSKLRHVWRDYKVGVEARDAALRWRGALFG